MIHFLGIQDTLKALADPIRREILNLLKNGRLSAGEICEHFPVFIYYELNASVLEEIMLWITDLKGASDNEGNDTEK